VRLNREAREAAAEVLSTVDDHIRRGFLPAAPAEQECRFCDYRTVCGPYEERRVSRKRQEPLDALARLRRRR